MLLYSPKIWNNLPHYREMPSKDVYHAYMPEYYHYENTLMQYTAIFHGCKNVNFQMNFFNIFLIFAQNIDCGYTLEPPH